MIGPALRSLMTAAVGAALAFADLEAIKAEPSLEKRSEKALTNATHRFDAARDAYQKGETALCETALNDVQESVLLSRDSLKETGKDPRKKFKHFKRAEISIRQLLRKMDSFRNEMSYLDREKLDPAMRTVQQIHEELLHAIMGGEKSSK